MKLFITGTDTDIGKTTVSIQLLKAFKQAGYTAIGLKPLATGNSNDAQQLKEASAIQLEDVIVNPIHFAPAIAPHIASAKENVALSVKMLAEKIQPGLTYPADIHVVEGVGGWHVPLNNEETMADFVKQCGLSVILVVGIKLGCLNHAILTAEAIIAHNVPLLGWIANHPMPDVTHSKEMIETLKTWIKAPLLKTVDYGVR